MTSNEFLNAMAGKRGEVIRMATIEHQKQEVRRETMYLSMIQWIVNVLAFIAVFVKAALSKGNGTIDVKPEMQKVLDFTKPQSIADGESDTKPKAPKVETKSVTELVWEKRERYMNLFD
jgi:hypothetical protein